MSNQATQVTQWHTLTSEAAAQQLEVNPEQGLGSAEAAWRDIGGQRVGPTEHESAVTAG